VRAREGDFGQGSRLLADVERYLDFFALRARRAVEA
jgi:hypothetical protein